MKLIHLISGGDVGGAKTHVLSLLQGLNRTEDVHLICFMEGPFAEEARCLGIPTTVIEGSNPMAVRKRILPSSGTTTASCCTATAPART